MRVSAIAIVAGFAVMAGIASATASVTMKSTANSALGKTIVVSATGRTLYSDRAEKKGAVKCLGSCTTEWLPLLITAGAKPVAGAGLKAAMLGTIKRPDGKTQVTFAGHPLYLYIGDTKPGEVNGQGVGGIWFALASTGAVVTTKASTTAGSSSSSTSGGKSTGSGSGSSTSGSSSSSGSGSSSSGSGSGSGSSPGSSSGPGTTNCTTDPGGYGCM
jgi:predicted lipoprotein with Yx(FWY)xxD motif